MEGVGLSPSVHCCEKEKEEEEEEAKAPEDFLLFSSGWRRPRDHAAQVPAVLRVRVSVHRQSVGHSSVAQRRALGSYCDSGGSCSMCLLHWCAEWDFTNSQWFQAARGTLPVMGAIIMVLCSSTGFFFAHVCACWTTRNSLSDSVDVFCSSEFLAPCIRAALRHCPCLDSKWTVFRGQNLFPLEGADLVETFDFFGSCAFRFLPKENFSI